MSIQDVELSSLVRMALAVSVSEGVLTDVQKAAMTSIFEAIVSELRAHRGQARQVLDGRREQIRQDLKRTSRFESQSSAQQIRSNSAQPQSVSTPGFFYGMTPAEAADPGTAKEPSRIERATVIARPWLHPGARSQAPRERAPQVPGAFFLGVRNGLKPAMIPGAAPITETNQSRQQKDTFSISRQENRP